MAQYATSNISEVGCALAQIGITHFFKPPTMLENNFAPGRLRRLALIDPGTNFLAETLVIEHLNIGREQKTLLLTNMNGQTALKFTNIFARLFNGELILLELCIVALAFNRRDGIQISNGGDNNNLT